MSTSTCNKLTVPVLRMDWGVVACSAVAMASHGSPWRPCTPVLDAGRRLLPTEMRASNSLVSPCSLANRGP
jgi:hypothetical protein